MPTELIITEEQAQYYDSSEFLKVLKFLLPLNLFKIDTINIPIKDPTRLSFTYKEHNEYTTILIKPDCVERALEGEIIQRLINKGLSVDFIHKTVLSHAVATRHYQEHYDKPYYPRIYGSIISGPLYVIKLSGPNCIQVVRNLVGATDPQKAMPGTIRGDYGTILPYNIIHASDSQESAKKELENLLADIILPNI
jgi:nucleoside-diphosphate kinase